MKPRRNPLEPFFERAPWATRLVMLVAVVAVVVLALASFYFALVDVAYLLSLLVEHASMAPPERSVARDEGLTTIVKALDGFLVGALLIVVALGLYELFVGKIEAAETSEVGGRLLKIVSLEDLKRRVAKLVVLILAIEFFQRALRLSYPTPPEMLHLAADIALVSGALYLIGRRGYRAASNTSQHASAVVGLTRTEGGRALGPRRLEIVQTSRGFEPCHQLHHELLPRAA